MLIKRYRDCILGNACPQALSFGLKHFGYWLPRCSGFCFYFFHLWPMTLGKSAQVVGNHIVNPGGLSLANGQNQDHFFGFFAAVPFAAGFLAGDFLAGAFLVGDFLAGVFSESGFFAVGFLRGAAFWTASFRSACQSIGCLPQISSSR
jgi:hypothetical protein